MSSIRARVLAALIILAIPLAPNAKTVSPTEAARHALPSFLKIVAERPAWASKFRVQAAVRDQDVSMVLFLSDFRAEPSGYSARLDKAPSQFTSVRSLQRVSVAITDITDWTYNDARDGTTHGHFGFCAELSSLSPAEFKEQKQFWLLSCKP